MTQMFMKEIKPNLLERTGEVLEESWLEIEYTVAN